jgi:hypothetical protein
MSDCPSYRPSAWYYRKALRDARTKDEAVAVGMQLIKELEHLKEFVREQGLIPPRRFILNTEAEDKGLTPPRAESS